VQSGLATTQPAHNESFLSTNAFYPESGGSVTLSFSVATNGRATLRVYSVSGDLVRTLFDEQVYTAGSQAILYTGMTDSRLVWNGTADDGLLVASGTYLILFDLNGERLIKKVNVLR
jgi:hypothetical protein